MTRSDLIALIVIILLVGGCLYPLVSGRLPVFFDDYYETFSRLFFNARALQSGALPLWDPHTFAGGRVNFIPNTTIWYFPSYPFYLLAPLGDVDAAYALIIKIPLFLHWLLAALSAYGFARLALRLNPPGSLVLSGVFAFGAAMSYNICDPSTVYATAWIPLALWGMTGRALRPRRILPLLGALAVSFIGPCGSDVRGIFSLATLMICLGTAALVTGLFGRMRLAGRLAAGGLIVLVIGFLLSGPYWTGMIETAKIYEGSPLLQVSRSASEMFSMPPRHFLTLAVPDLFGTLTGRQGVNLGFADLADYSHLEGNITGGFALVLIILLGSLLGWKRGRGEEETVARIWWVVGLLLTVFSLLLVAGRYSPFYRALTRAIPAFGLPYALRWRVMEHLGMALLAGVSAHWLWSFRERAVRLAAVVLAVLVLAAVLWQLLVPLPPDGHCALFRAWRDHRHWLVGNLLPYLSAALALAALVWFFFRARWLPALLTGAVLIESAFLGFSVVYFLSWGDVPEWVKYPRPSATWYYRLTGAARDPSPSPETGTERTAFSFSLLDQTATLQGGDYLLGHCSKPLVPRLRDVLEDLTEGYPYALRMKDPASRFFPNMSVRDLVLESPRALPPETAESHTVAGADDWRRFRLQSVMPRVFTQDCLVLASPEESRTELLGGDLREAVFLEAEEIDRLNRRSGELLPYESLLRLREVAGEDRRSHFGKLQEINRIGRVSSPTPNRMVVEVSIEAPALLVTTDVFYPGWSVAVDGEDGIPLRVNYLQRGVWLEKGVHVVEWRFRPPAVRWGFVLIGIGVILSIVILLRPAREEEET
jgi:hypothetical protein